MRKVMVAIISMVLVLSVFTSCAKKKDAKIKITITGTNGPGDSQSLAHEEFAKRLNALGGWDADIKVSSEMGSTDDVTEAGMQGAPLVAASDPSRIASYVPDFGILMMPYLLNSYDQLANLMETELYKGWEKELEAKGIVLLTNNCLTGFRNWVTNKKIEKPSDLNGLKIRTIGNDLCVEAVNAMGAIATPMSQSDCYQGIQLKSIDGGEWQIPTIYSSKFYEVAKHISLSNHFLLTGSITVGKKWFDTLPEEKQIELKKTARETYGDNQALVKQLEKDYIEKMVNEYGVTVTTPDRQAFIDATEYMYAKKGWEGLRTELYKQLGVN